MHSLSNEVPRFKIGLFGIGLEAYWTQFEGLEEKLTGYVQEVGLRLEQSGAGVVNIGLVDSTDKAFAAGHLFRKEDVDLIFLYVTTYALSSTVLPVVRRAGVPVVVLNLAPGPAINYRQFNLMNDRTRMTAAWLSYCSACPVPEIANVFLRSGIPFHQVTGMLNNDPEAWEHIEEWVAAAKTAHILSHNRLGLMGNYYGGMLDIYTDLTLQCATFGGHMEIIEVDELTALRQTVTEEQISAKTAAFEQAFAIAQDCAAPEIRKAAITAVALDKLVAGHQLGSLAYYHKGTGVPGNEETMSSVILGNSLLTANGIPVAGEYEVKNAQAMKIMDCFGAGGSFTEYYAMDFNDDVVLMGHDGPCHAAIAQGKIKVKPLEVYHGKVGSGLSVEMSAKHGPVTLLSVMETGDRKIVLLIAEGSSVEGPILEIGNTNSRYHFIIGARAFVEGWNAAGPAHHCAIGTGHIARKIEKLGLLLGISTIRIC